MTTTQDLLRSYASRMERLLDEIDGLKDDLKDLKAEIKNAGFNVKALDRLVAMKRKDKADEQASLFNDILLYAEIVGVTLDVVAPAADAAPDPAPEPARAAAAKVEEPAGDRVSEPAPAQTDLVDYLSKRVPPDRVGAEEMGRRARKGGKPITACPYDMGTDGTSRSLWRMGWQAEDRLTQAGAAA